MEGKEKIGGERGIRTRLGPLIESTSYGCRREFSPLQSPQTPIAGTKAGTSNPSLPELGPSIFRFGSLAVGRDGETRCLNPATATDPKLPNATGSFRSTPSVIRHAQ